ncbi:MAG: hypothetical protein ACRYGI_06965 [Janthinobacterium lividum]
MADRKRPVARRLDPGTEALRRRSGRNRALLVVLLLFALLFYGLTMVKIISHGPAGSGTGIRPDGTTRNVG